MNKLDDADFAVPTPATTYASCPALASASARTASCIPDADIGFGVIMIRACLKAIRIRQRGFIILPITRHCGWCWWSRRYCMLRSDVRCNLTQSMSPSDRRSCAGMQHGVQQIPQARQAGKVFQHCLSYSTQVHERMDENCTWSPAGWEGKTLVRHQ